MTVPAKHTLTEAHFLLADQEREIERLRTLGERTVAYWFARRHGSPEARALARGTARDLRLWRRTFAGRPR